MIANDTALHKRQNETEINHSAINTCVIKNQCIPNFGFLLV